jgi:Ala-tRNA(Pro) deacylase
MLANKLNEFLDQQKVKYVRITHSLAYTAQEVAESVHVSGRDFAKTLMVHIDGKPALVVLPANRRLVLSDFCENLGTDDVKLATEDELKAAFPDCELGAMPPFGNLYGMEVYAAESLAREREITFNAGSHTEVIKMAYQDFERLVNPRVLNFTV